MAISVLMKVMPEDTDTDMERIEKTVKDKVEVEDIRIEKVAFGLKAVKALTLVEDKENAADEVQEKVSEIDGVREVEIEEVNKI